MSPKIKRRFHAIIRRSGIRPRRVLEVGGVMGEGSLLRFPELAGAERYCLNLVAMDSDAGITAVQGNANDMREVKDAEGGVGRGGHIEDGIVGRRAHGVESRVEDGGDLELAGEGLRAAALEVAYAVHGIAGQAVSRQMGVANDAAGANQDDGAR